MTIPPEDPGARTGSAPTLLLTIVGLYVRRLGGWVATADLVRLLGELDVPGAGARTAIARLKKRGLLESERRERGAGYALTPRGEQVLDAGDRSIFSVPTMRVGDPWCVVSFTVPESQRALRGRLRRQLAWIGCGMLSQGLWIAPEGLRSDIEEILERLQLRSAAVLLRTEQPDAGVPIREAVAQWWDLERIAALHRTFLARVRPSLADDPVDDADAFRRYVEGLDAWRVIPYLDPGLPAEFLPDDWPGKQSIPLFEELHARFADAAWRHVLDESVDERAESDAA